MNKLIRILAIVLIVLAAGLAVMAWWLSSRSLSSRPAGPELSQTTSYPSIAATRDLHQGDPITAMDIKVVMLPYMAPGAFRDVGSVIGEIPLIDIHQDAIITENNLAHGLAMKLHPGQRAVAIPVDESIGVGNKIEAGDYVDVFVTLRRADETDKGQSRLLASRRQVLAYGAAVAGQSAISLPANNDQALPLAQPSQARSAVLAIAVDQVNALLLAAQNGKITLALRHPSDQGVADPNLFPALQPILRARGDLPANQKQQPDSPDNRAFSGVSMASLAGSAATPPPVQAGVMAPVAVSTPGVRPRARQSLEIIRGNQRENIDF